MRSKFIPGVIVGMVGVYVYHRFIHPIKGKGA